jgi:hypothetical protein
MKFLFALITLFAFSGMALASSESVAEQIWETQDNGVDPYDITLQRMFKTKRTNVMPFLALTKTYSLTIHEIISPYKGTHSISLDLIFNDKSTLDINIHRDWFGEQFDGFNAYVNLINKLIKGRGYTNADPVNPQDRTYQISAEEFLVLINVDSLSDLQASPVLQTNLEYMRMAYILIQRD